jgi:hypothetical protein
LITSVKPGEDYDQAYARLYGSQMRPCTFRRVFAAIQSGATTTEVDEAAATKIKGYVTEGMSVDEAFVAHCPEFVGPGEFVRAYDKEMKARRNAAASSPPAPSAKVKTRGADRASAIEGSASETPAAG